ncbi:Importin subunit alpha-2 [Platanthera guangdongensis]|uniref:Importin subunit alpha-2 n=1 Tax=Platanthera guangdongensis TaxID=2320717 RepID=A0ABR2MAR8_9ASPA
MFFGGADSFSASSFSALSLALTHPSRELSCNSPSVAAQSFLFPKQLCALAAALPSASQRPLAPLTTFRYPSSSPPHPFQLLFASSSPWLLSSNPDTIPTLVNAHRHFQFSPVAAKAIAAQKRQNYATACGRVNATRKLSPFRNDKTTLPPAVGLRPHEKSFLPVAEQCAWALGNVAGEEDELRIILLAQGALVPLARLMLSNKGSTAQTAAWALSNLIKEKMLGNWFTPLFRQLHLNCYMQVIEFSEDGGVDCQHLLVS